MNPEWTLIKIIEKAALYEYSVYANNKIFRKGNALLNSMTKAIKTNRQRSTGLDSGTIIMPLLLNLNLKQKPMKLNQIAINNLNVSIKPQDKNLAPGESVTYDFSIYDGPQNPWLMKKYQKGFEKIVAFSNFRYH